MLILKKLKYNTSETPPLKTLQQNFFNFFFYDNFKLQFITLSLNSSATAYKLQLHSPSQFYWLCFLIRYNQNFCTYTQDYTAMSYKNGLLSNILFCSYFTYFSLHLQTFFTTNRTQSLSYLWRGNQWLERELSDFYTLLFSNATDTRRLLTDYTFTKGLAQTHQKQYQFWNNYLQQNL